MIQKIITAVLLSAILLILFQGCENEQEIDPDASDEATDNPVIFNGHQGAREILGSLTSAHKTSFTAGVYHLGKVYERSMEISYDVTANSSNIDGVMGWGADAPIDAYQDFSAIVRMNQNGYFDVMNGSVYGFDERVEYQGNTTYHVRLVINIPESTYNVWINDQPIASNYEFRKTALSMQNIAQFGLISGFEDKSFTVINLNIAEEDESEVYFSKTGFSRGIYPLDKTYTGTVKITYEALAHQNNIDGVMGWAASDASITGYNSFFALVRMNQAGFIDVRKGNSYESEVNFEYVSDVYYRIKIIANALSGQYDVWVNDQQIATDYAFRSDAVSNRDFSSLGLISSDLDDVLEVKNINIEEIEGEPDDRDVFDIQKIYPDKVSGGESWAVSDGFEDLNRVKISGNVSKNGDTWIGTPNSKNSFRVAVYIKEGIDDDVTLIRGADHSLLAREGYMQEPHDWKNVEMTGYFRVSQVSDLDEEVTLYARTGNHRSGSTKEKCQGTAYKVGIEFNGAPNLRKEMHHPSGYVSPPDLKQHFNMGSIINRWVGLKSIMYNVYKDDGSVSHVKMEMYLDVTPEDKTDPWTLFYEEEDRGNWDGEQFVVDNCMAEGAREMIVWGGPAATFRIDDANKVEFKNLSVREIEPPL